MEGVKFVSYTELEKYFLSGDEMEILDKNEKVVSICTIADYLFSVEQFHKDNLSIEGQLLRERLSKIVKIGRLFLAEVDRRTLLDNMFEFDDSLELWMKPCRKSISPRFSISLIALKPNKFSFWSDNVFNEMEEYFLSLESYE